LLSAAAVVVVGSYTVNIIAGGPFENEISVLVVLVG